MRLNTRPTMTQADLMLKRSAGKSEEVEGAEELVDLFPICGEEEEEEEEMVSDHETKPVT